MSDEFEVLYREHARDLESFIFQHVRDRGLAEDLVQETFIRAFRAWPTVDKSRPFGPWLRTIAMRLCIDTWRAQTAGRVFTLDVEPNADALPAQGADPAEVLPERARHNGIGEALDGLSARHRRILVMKDSFGMRYEEIAKVEGTTLAAIRCSLSIARRRFREKYLALTDERSFGALIFLPFLKGLRATKRLGMRIAATIYRTNLGSGAESLVAQPTMQISSGIVAIAVVLGTFPFSGHVRPRDVAPDGSIAHPTFTFGAEPLYGASPVASHGRYVPVSSLPARSDGWTVPADAGTVGVAPSGDDSGGTGAAQGDGGPSAQGTDPTQVPTIGPDDLPPSPDGVGVPVDEEPPAQPQDVTDPNQNVRQPEDARIFSFTASRDGSTVFASGENRECALQVNCPSVLFRSTDGGATWTALDGTNLDGGTVLLPPAYGSGDKRVFATSGDGVLMVSPDGGDTFAPVAAGASQFAGAAAMSPGFDSGDPRIVVGARPSTAQYDDRANTIVPAPYATGPAKAEPAFASRDLLLLGGLKANDGGRWGAAVYRCPDTTCKGVRLSDDAESPKLRISPDFQTNRTLYAFTSIGIYRSTDGGSSFTRIERPAQTAVSDLVVGDGVILAALTTRGDPSPDDGLYSSTDGGSSWIKVSDPLLGGGTTAISANGSRIFVGLSGGGVACSSDAGATWSTRC